MLTGFQRIAGKRYYFDNGGVRKTGWIEKDGKKYYGMPDGSLRTGWLSFGDIYYYCDIDGATVAGDYAVEGVLYTFGAKGIMEKKSGWGEYKGNKYYFNPATGFPYRGWVSFGEVRYYADSRGIMVSGWQLINGEYYYFNPDTKILVRNETEEKRKKVEQIKKYKGCPYVYGGTNPNGWDCSGCIQWIYKNIFQISLPRTTYEQVKVGKVVNLSDMNQWQPGDLLFFGNYSVSHVGIYLGNGEMLHALGTKYGTRIDNVIWYDSWDTGVSLRAVRRVF